MNLLMLMLRRMRTTLTLDDDVAPALERYGEAVRKA